MPGQTPDIRDIKGLMDLYPWYRPGLWMTALVLLAFAGIGTWLYRRKWPKKSKSDRSVALSPETIALNALDSLKTKAGEANPKPFHFGISEILRIFLESRFDFPATERTTEEIRRVLPTIAWLDETNRNQVLQLLQKTDRVKFTDFVPSRTENDEVWAQCRAVIQALPKEPAPQAIATEVSQ